ncbi:hypothetical protein SOCE26_037540 [Sorangium cellulosum]|uniref:Uncharacterized protein n=1 Tax=Sorangium cellulosum TaxID=56 RepID=A0A2L0ESR6_SORCE|nr:efflux RND transporter periplasmic adaptor subunit [Sorangium cellulosum]AUX42324.1 hypothetical protein SOCE26_037540 [Sorangium cellulosum]
MSGRPRRVWRWLLGFTVAVATSAVLLRQNFAGPAPIDPALVVTARRGNLTLEILETGKIEAREQIELKSKVAGQVAQVLVDEGDQVKKGQLLLVLDATDHQREVTRAEAELAQARAGVAFAKTSLDRVTAGVAGNVIPASELDMSKHTLVAKDISVRLAQVALVAARDRLAYTKIASPIDGTVIQRNIEPGEVVTPGVESTFDGKALLTVANLATLVVTVELNQIDVVKVRLGQPATLTLDALPGRTYEAKITKIAPASVRAQGREVDVFPVEAELVSVDGSIKPGMTADVRVRIEENPSVISLPIEAIVEENGKTFVTRVVGPPGGKPSTEKVEVATGARSDHAVEVVSGLEEGSRVLIDPASAAPNEAQM